MKKIGWIIALVVVVACVSVLYVVAWKQAKPTETLCAEVENDTFIVLFEENGGAEVKDITLKASDTTEGVKLPTPTRKKYKFVGWYLDKELTQAAEYTTTKEIVPQPVKDEDGCTVSYKDITLYAKWKKK